MEEPIPNLAAGVVRRVRGPTTRLALADLGFFDAVRLPQPNVLDSFYRMDVHLLLFRRQINSIIHALIFRTPLRQGEVPVSYTHLTLPTNREV